VLNFETLVFLAGFHLLLEEIQKRKTKVKVKGKETLFSHSLGCSINNLFISLLQSSVDFHTFFLSTYYLYSEKDGEGEKESE
jgi:hypothetical protein